MGAHETITQFDKMLENLDRWLAAGVTCAERKKVPPDLLVGSRLALDQYELVRQVQAACDQAKFAAAYLSGQKAPAHPDTEKTVAEMRARIATCRAYLKSIAAAQYAGAAERRVAPPWLNGQWMRGDRYLAQVAIPNFYFHVVTAYAILRHNGVELGKMDYVGGLPLGEG
jgi:hypothetical protein